MINTFFLSQKIKSAYRVNSIIFSIKQIPLIGKLLPSNLYQNSAFKIIAIIINFLLDLSNIFVTKPIYLMLAIFLPNLADGKINIDGFLHVFVFLTIAGTILNCHFFEASKHKFYAITILRMDSTKYILSNYCYFLGKILIGFLAICLPLAAFSFIDFYLVLLLPLFIIFSKAIVIAFLLLRSHKAKKVFNEDKPTPIRWIFIIGTVIIAYLLPNLGFTITSGIFLILFTISALLGIPSLIYIFKFKNYTGVYKRFLTPDVIIFSVKKTAVQQQDIGFKKILNSDAVDTKGKTGFAYFHEIFMKRHRKILTNSAISTAVIAFIAVVGALVGIFYDEEFRESINELTLLCLPLFMYFMLVINRGPVITRAMFLNCDKIMLKYRFYKQPNAILTLFTKRLISLIKINLLPAIVIATGLPLLLYFSGGTDNPLNYLVLFASIIAMSVFFSVHYLMLYYLLQPLNEEAKSKSITYKIANSITWVVVFVFLNIELPTLLFGLLMLIFMVAYIIIALFLVYKFASKTFKLR